MDTEILKCIYCDGDGPFNEEHVFPAGLGGDDRRFILRDVVCALCNGEFSKLESHLMRNSPAALMRVALNAPGRSKGRDGGAPSLQIAGTSLFEPQTGLAQEAELGAGGEARVLPQIILVNQETGEIRLCGPNAEESPNFVSLLASTLADNVMLVCKRRTESKAEFEVATYSWNGYSYELVDATTVLHPPSKAVWLAELAPVDASTSDRVFRTRMFRREKGNVLVLRLLRGDRALTSLSFARSALRALQAADLSTANRTIDQPDMLLQLDVIPEILGRAIAKIGINLAHWLFGGRLPETPSLRRTKRSARFGGDPIQFVTLPEPGAKLHFSVDAKQHHLLMLLCIPSRTANQTALVAGVKLFDGQFDTVVLANDLPESLLAEPVLFLVHYRTNTIEQKSLADFVAERMERPVRPK